MSMAKLDGNAGSVSEFHRLFMRAGGRAIGAAAPGEFRQRIVHDGADRPRAAPALRAAAETAVDLRGGARAVRTRIHAAADVAVGQDIAGTDDHASGPSLEWLKTVADATI